MGRPNIASGGCEKKGMAMDENRDERTMQAAAGMEDGNLDDVSGGRSRVVSMGKRKVLASFPTCPKCGHFNIINNPEEGVVYNCSACGAPLE